MLAALDVTGIWSAPITQMEVFLGQFGRAGTAVWFVFAVNVTVVGLLLLIAIPLYFLRRDLRKTLNRFGVFETRLTVDPTAPYEEVAEKLFAENPKMDVFCYGHTHRPGIQELESGILVNTGTWLKRLHQRDGIIGLLPPVFYPSYRLYVVQISPDDAGVAVEFEQIEKSSPSTEELTLTERLFTVGQDPDPDPPKRVVVEPDNPPDVIVSARTESSDSSH
jgi:hypothetical protein